MQRHRRRREEQRHHNVEPDAGKDKPGDGDGGECREDEAVVKLAAEHDDGAIAEKVEEEPRGEDGEEDDEGDREPEEAKEHEEEHDHGVVHAEVAEVALHAERGLAEGVGARERVEREELLPRPARGEGGGSGSSWGVNGRHCVEVRSPNSLTLTLTRRQNGKCFVSFWCNNRVCDCD